MLSLPLPSFQFPSLVLHFQIQSNTKTFTHPSARRERPSTRGQRQHGKKAAVSRPSGLPSLQQLRDRRRRWQWQRKRPQRTHVWGELTGFGKRGRGNHTVNKKKTAKPVSLSLLLLLFFCVLYRYYGNDRQQTIKKKNE